VADVVRDTKALLPQPDLRDPGEVDPEWDADEAHKGHDSWQLLGVHTPEQDFEMQGTGKDAKVVQRGAIDAPVARYICTAAGYNDSPCGIVKEEPWTGQ
jgi:hypothetical protein